MNWDFKLNITTLLLIIAGAFAVWQWTKAGNEANRWRNNYHTSQVQADAYKINAEGEIAYWKASELLTQRELKEALKSDSINAELAKKYKKLSETVKIETVFKTKWDTLEVRVPIYIDKDTTVQYSDICLSFDLSVSNGLIGVSGLGIRNQLNFVSGDRRLGFMKGTEYSVDVFNTNPCIITTGVTSYKVIHKPKIWEQPYVWGGVGFIAGFILGGK